MASEHFRSEKLAINRFFSVSKIEFKKLSSAFEAESFEKLIAGRALSAGEPVWLKYLKNLLISLMEQFY